MTQEKQSNNFMPISKSLQENKKYMEDRIGYGVSFDLTIRDIKIFDTNINIYLVNGLMDSNIVTNILNEIISINYNEEPTTELFPIIKNRIDHGSVEVFETMDELVDRLLSGLICIVIEGDTKGITIDVRSYPGRTPMEPDTEKVIRGSRDGFVENIILNTALTRRRIKDERLRFEIMSVGERSKTDVSVGYIKDIANPEIVQLVKERLQTINVDGIPMADKTVEEYIFKQGFDPFPYVRYTERPDVAANHLLEGHVLIYVDTSPSVIITPTTYFHHLQHAEEYRQAPAVGTFERWMRFIGVWASLFLLPIWFLLALEPTLLPETLKFIGLQETTNVPLIVQIFIADFGIEVLRMAAIHTPSPLATAMGLVAAILIGQVAIDVGLFVPEVILYVAVAAIGTYTTPSYELSVANKIARLIMLLAVAVFRAEGLIVAVTIFILWLAYKKLFNTPYLWPFIPFYPKALLHILIRREVPGSKLRPAITMALDRVRQPKDGEQNLLNKGKKSN